MRAGDSRRSRRLRSDDGAALVEFALVAPLLFLLVFGIIEFGSAYFQQLDLRHGAREGLRLLAVNAEPANSESNQVRKIARETCNRMDVDGSTVLIVIDVDGSLVSDPAGDATINDVGDEVTITVSKDLEQLTGFLDFALGNINLRSSVSTRLEQAATYGDLTVADNFTC